MKRFNQLFVVVVQFCCGVLSRSPSRCERAETRTASPRLIPYPREIIQEQIASILPLLNQPRSPTPFRLQHRSYQAACQKQCSYLEEWYRTHWSKSVCLNIRVFLEGTEETVEKFASLRDETIMEESKPSGGAPE